MATKLYTPKKLIVSFGGKSHATVKDRLLCSSIPLDYAQECLDVEPTCGWCKLIIATKKQQRRRTP